jgi:hypothetical protein
MTQKFPATLPPYPHRVNRHGVFSYSARAVAVACAQRHGRARAASFRQKVSDKIKPRYISKSPPASRHEIVHVHFLCGGEWTSAPYLPPPPSLISGAARRMVGNPLPPFGHPPPHAGEGRSIAQRESIGRIRHCESPSPTSSLRGAKRRGNPVRSTRRAAPLNKKGEKRTKRPFLPHRQENSVDTLRMERTGLPRRFAPRNDEAGGSRNDEAGALTMTRRGLSQ